MQMKARDILIYFSAKYKGDYFEMLNALRQKEKYDDEEAKKYNLVPDGVSIITILDENYPHSFRTIPNPPIVFYLKGKLELLDDLSKSIAVIGTRENSEYGKTVTDSIVSELISEGFTIVSGLARGIDGLAHEAALRRGGKTIAILGSGINYPYPASNKKLYEEIIENGLIISEYPDRRMPEPELFKYRNRLVAALTQGILVVESKYRSGTLITVGHALERGSDIYCIPERVGKESGTNRLIKDGAYLVESASDIVKLWQQ